MRQLTEIAIPKFSLKESNISGNGIFGISELSVHPQEHPAMLLSPHRKDFYFMVLVKAGDSRHWVDMEPYTLKPNALYFTVPAQVLIKEKTKPSVGKLLGFTEDFLAIEENRELKNLPILQNPHNGHELSLTDENLEFVDDVLTKMLKEYEQRHDWKNSMLLAYLRILLIYLSRLYNEQFKGEELSGDRLILKKFKTLIDEQFAEVHDVSGYAEKLFISAGYLSEAVKQQSGKTAIEHIHERIMLEAKRLLFHTDLSIKEIAWKLGFEDASYFNRFFKRLGEETPMGYRKQIRDMYH